MRPTKSSSIWVDIDIGLSEGMSSFSSSSRVYRISAKKVELRLIFPPRHAPSKGYVGKLLEVLQNSLSIQQCSSPFRVQ